jgi:hypothetical protein
MEGLKRPGQVDAGEARDKWMGHEWRFALAQFYSAKQASFHQLYAHA